MRAQTHTHTKTRHQVTHYTNAKNTKRDHRLYPRISQNKLKLRKRYTGGSPNNWSKVWRVLTLGEKAKASGTDWRRRKRRENGDRTGKESSGAVKTPHHAIGTLRCCHSNVHTEIVEPWNATTSPPNATTRGTGGEKEAGDEKKKQAILKRKKLCPH